MLVASWCLGVLVALNTLIYHKETRTRRNHKVDCEYNLVVIFEVNLFSQLPLGSQCINHSDTRLPTNWEMR
jgi:hypothetical protein